MFSTLSTINFGSSYPGNCSSQCMDPDMETFVDFNAVSSPTTSVPQQIPLSRSTSAMASPSNALMEVSDDFQTPAKPAYNYDQFKQQVGLPAGSMAALQTFNQLEQQTGFTGVDLEYDDASSSLAFNGLAPGASIDDGFPFDAEMNTNNGSFMVLSQDTVNPDNSFINPHNIMGGMDDQTSQNIRYFPGVHQQVAMAKAQALQQAKQQRMLQQQQQFQFQKQKQVQGQSSTSMSSRNFISQAPIDARSEEAIARVMNQIRKNSSTTSDSAPISQSTTMFPPSFRTKKEEDEMDEDERLLASEEGKKLSSKERRQLRNKVSARAFRSRRKEYISQLETEVSVKTAEINDLRRRNSELMAENTRSRNFITLLLRHPAFQPFLEDLSRDPSLSDPLPEQQGAAQSSSSQPRTSSSASASTRADGFSSNTKQPPTLPSQRENLDAGRISVPEQQSNVTSTSMDVSQSNWATPGMNFGFSQPQVYAIFEVPSGPSNPLDVAVITEKDSEVETDDYSYSSAKEEGLRFAPTNAHWNVTEAITEEKSDCENSVTIDESDPMYASICLYVNSGNVKKENFNLNSEEQTNIKIFSEKPGHFELVPKEVKAEVGSEDLTNELQVLCAKIEPAYKELSSLISKMG